MRVHAQFYGDPRSSSLWGVKSESTFTILYVNDAFDSINFPYCMSKPHFYVNPYICQTSAIYSYCPKISPTQLVRLYSVCHSYCIILGGGGGHLPLTLYMYNSPLPPPHHAKTLSCACMLQCCKHCSGKNLDMMQMWGTNLPIKP